MRREGFKPEQETFEPTPEEKRGFQIVKTRIDQIAKKVARRKLGKKPKIKIVPIEQDHDKDD